MEPNTLISAHTVAELLRVDRTTVARHRRLGKLNAVYRVPGSGAYLYDRAEIERLATEVYGVNP